MPLIVQMKNPSKANINDFFKSDRAILMVCIGIALVFWLLLKLSHTYKTSKDFQIIYQLPEGKSMVESPPEKVRLGLQARGFDLLYLFLPNEVPSIQYTLADQETQSISASQIMNKARLTLSNIEVTDVNYDYIIINLDEQDEKRVPVNLIHDIQFETGFQLQDSILIEPDSVSLRGPYSIIDGFNSWDSAPLRLENVKTTFEEEVPLVIPFDKVVSVRPEQVQVRAVVEQNTEKSLFVPLNVKNAPDSLKIFPDKIKLSGTVGLSKYNTVSEADFQLEVDLKGIPLHTENNTIPVSIIKYPAYVKNIQISPKSVEFFFVQSNNSLQ